MESKRENIVKVLKNFARELENLFKVFNNEVCCPKCNSLLVLNNKKLENIVMILFASFSMQILLYS